MWLLQGLAILTPPQKTQINTQMVADVHRCGVYTKLSILDTKSLKLLFFSLFYD